MNRMPMFSYRIMDAAGGMQTGKIENSSLEDAKRELCSTGVTLVEVRPVSLWDTELSELAVFRRRVKKSDVALFCRQLSFLLSSGVKITDAFDMLLSASKPGAFREALSAIQDDLRKGGSLSDGLRKQKDFPAELAGMAHVGELSGHLPQILSKNADHYEREVRTEEELKSAMIYPALVSAMMIGVMIIAVTVVVPNYVQLFVAGGVQLPLPTQVLIAMSVFLRTYYAHVLSFFVMIMIGVYGLLRTQKGRYFVDYIRLHFPIYSHVYLKRLNLRFVQSLSVMLDAGQPIVLSLSAVKTVINNRVIGEAIDKMSVRLKEGEAFHTCIREVRYFEPMLCSMALMGEETGRLAQVLDRCAEYFQHETDALIGRLNKLVDPVVTIALGLILAFLMMAVMLPTFALTDIM